MRKKKLTAGQKRAIAALKRYNRERKSGKSKRRSKGAKKSKAKTGRGVHHASKSSRSSGRRRGRRRSMAKGILRTLTPGLLTIEVAALSVGADVIEETVTNGAGVRFADPLAGVLVAIGLAHGSNDIVQVGYGLEVRKLAREHYGENADGLPRESLEELAVGLIRKLLPGGKSSGSEESAEESAEGAELPAGDVNPNDEGVAADSAASSATY